MSSSRLTEIADRELRRIAQSRGSADHVLLYLAKVTEELGETAAEIAELDDSVGAPSDALLGELADLLISAAVLGRALGIDLDAALDQRAARLDRRWNQRGYD